MKSEKPQPIVLDKSRQRAPPDFDQPLLIENDYTVEFSNRGEKVHYDPNPVNLRKSTMACIFPGCGRLTNRIDGLCADHCQKPGRNDVPKVYRAHWADWIGRIIPPGMNREKCLTWAPPHIKFIEILVSWKDETGRPRSELDPFIIDLMTKISGSVYDSTTLQKDWETKGPKAAEMTNLAKRIVDDNFPENEYSSVKTEGKKYNNVALRDLPIRIAAACLVIGVVSEEANRGDLWCYTSMGKPNQSKRASVYMPMAYYLLRRYTPANTVQARQSIRH